ncbi:IS110 family transposase [Magnetospira sp. QH-2]|uniref:IS110 family transposase n=1 Tax=Magnetospira sp. (strain QH-2) TaxID=1288970 RepID=UPI0003E81137|nr:IS110 family transposase [Magnetospira sp. QH-2]CCQ74656.1 putative transposase [Magnetospira sp. QH-2]
MEYFVGMDVSMASISICEIDAKGTVIREGKVSSTPEAVATWLEESGRGFARIGLEAGPLAPWLYAGLSSRGLPVICIETRQMKAFASASPVKTDRRDARLIGQAMRTGLYRATHVKTARSQELRMVLTHRETLVHQVRQLSNTVRGTLKAFGLKVGMARGRLFAARVRELTADNPHLSAAAEPLLLARQALLEQLDKLDRQVHAAARDDSVCRRLMTVPGVGPVTALAFRTGLDVPERFQKSVMVGAHFGLVPRRYASGEQDRSGPISKCGDAMVRWLLFEAANALLTRTRRWSWLKHWGLAVAKRRGMKRAKVAVARRLAVIMHRMWIDGTDFQYRKEETAI